MIKHADFLDRVSQVFGEDQSTVKLAYRLIRESGALEGKRGRHAPERSPADAAKLWCWMGISDKPVMAPTAVEDFGLSPLASKFRDGEEPTMHAVLGLQNSHTLLDALSALITAEAADRELPPYTVEFQADDLSVTIDCGFQRLRYSRDQGDDAAAYEERYTRPYRLIRQFPRSFVRKIAAIFQQAENAENHSRPEPLKKAG